MSLGTRAFYNNVLSSEGDMFGNCQISRKSFKVTLLKELLEVAFNLARRLISEIIPKMLLETTEVVEEAEKMGIRIEWFDKVIGKILEVKEHKEKVSAIKKRMEVLEAIGRPTR